MQSYEVSQIKVGTGHQQPRVWLEGARLNRAGFPVGAKYRLAVAGASVVLTVAPDGERVVSRHTKRGRELPVVDLNSAKDLGVFAGLERIRVVIRPNEIRLLPLASQRKADERLARITARMQAGEPLVVGSLCHGGGTTSYAVHEGMAEAGVATTLKFANDVDPEVLFHAAESNQAWNPRTMAVAAPMQEIVTDDWLLRQLGHVDLLEAGIPCVAASISGRAKKHLVMAEEDPHAGHLVAAFLAIVQATQPAVVLVENVPPYQKTASAHIIRSTLRDWGYTTSEAVLDSREFGALESRKRLALVAMTAGLAFDFGTVVKDAGTHQLAEYLDPVPPDAACWTPMTYLRDKEVRDAAAGKGFRMQVVGPESTSIGTLGAGYQKNRSTEPKVRHPVQGDALLRLLTPAEHARIKGVPEAMVEGLPATAAHHLLGNGVSVHAFRALARALGSALLAAAAPRRTARLAA